MKNCPHCIEANDEVMRLLWVNRHYKEDAMKYATECEQLERRVAELEAELASEKEKDTIARFDQYY